MPINLHNQLPPWRKMRTGEDGDSWRWKEDVDAAKAVYEQWAEVYSTATLIADSLDKDDDQQQFTQEAIFENLIIVSAKIQSAAGDTLYIIKMENAALIRFNCRQLWEQIAFAVLSDWTDKQYKNLIEEQIEEFKRRMRHWIGTFKKDDIEDEWGLFV